MYVSLHVAKVSVELIRMRECNRVFEANCLGILKVCIGNNYRYFWSMI